MLVGASPGIADPAGRTERRAADEALAARIETMEIEDFAREWVAAVVRRAAGTGRSRRLRGPVAEHAGGLAAALRGLGTGVMEPLWERLGELTIP